MAARQTPRADTRVETYGRDSWAVTRDASGEIVRASARFDARHQPTLAAYAARDMVEAPRADARRNLAALAAFRARNETVSLLTEITK